MYIHSFSNSSDLLWTKASDYIITQKKIASETIDFIQPSKDSKLIKYSPVFDSESKNNNFENPLSIDLDDLFKIDLEGSVRVPPRDSIVPRLHHHCSSFLTLLHM